jgi:hypothetical protein
MVQFTLPHMATASRGKGPKREYRPLGSVWDGEDADLIEEMLSRYPRKPPKRILDATVNGGRFWRGSKRAVTGLDIEIQHKPTVVADNTQMPFRSEVFDVIVYDPPHIPNQGKERRSPLVSPGDRSAWFHTPLSLLWTWGDADQDLYV